MLWLIPVDTHAKRIDRWPPPGQPTLYKSEYCELAHIHCLHGLSVAAVRKGPVACDGNFRSRQRHAKIPFVACRADRARTLRRKQAPCARLRSLIGISLAEIAEIPWASRRRRLESHGRITNCATEGTRQGWLPWPRLPVYRPPGKRGPSRASTSWMSGQVSSIASATRR